MEKRTASDYRVSAWSGGTTTQLAICPETAVYADREFLWRVSSATVELEASDFTLLPDYDRLIATLEGSIVLTHNGGAPVTLQPFEVHAFSGADETRSVGRCRDFNLMLRRGRVRGSMEALVLTETPVSLCADAAGEQLLVYCAFGQCTAKEAEIETDVACPPTCTDPVGDGSSVPQGERIFRSAQNDGTGNACPPSSSAAADCVTLQPGESLLCAAPACLTLRGNARLMVCRILPGTK